MVSKVIGRLFSASPEMKKSIGTENERSLGYSEIFRYLGQNNLKIVKKISLDFPLYISPEDPMPALLRFMVNTREVLYRIASKIFSPMMRGRIMLIIAEK